MKILLVLIWPAVSSDVVLSQLNSFYLIILTIELTTHLNSIILLSFFVALLFILQSSAY